MYCKLKWTSDLTFIFEISLQCDFTLANPKLKVSSPSKSPQKSPIRDSPTKSKKSPDKENQISPKK